MNTDKQIYFWAHMLDEAFSKHMLTEGKHWPEDYIKTAINTVKGSQVGKQLWCTDEFLADAFVGQHDINHIDVKDVSHNPRQYGILGKFEPLMHKNSNLGFFAVIARWLAEYSGASQEKFQAFINEKLNDIVKVLLKIASDKTYNSQKDIIKKMSFVEFESLAKSINDQSLKDDIVASANMKFSIVPIYSYDELHDRYGGPVTGYKGDSEWCHTNGKGTYDSENWTDGGKNMFFVIEADGWENITAPNQKPETCYDEYGMSLIAILVDAQSNKLLHSTSRWNHVVLPKSGAADSMFESWQQLNKAIKLDVEKFCLDECKELREKLQQKSRAANEALAKILKNAKIITDATIPKELRNAVTEVNIPFSVESIGDYAFAHCTSFKSIIIPDSVENIGEYAFYYCTSLESINVPDSVENIGEYAFYNCRSLESITIPDSVKSIGGQRTFYNCTSLKSITIPDSVKSIGKWAFAYCTSLKSITIPDSVKSIGKWAFIDCASLNEVIFKGKTIGQVNAMANYPWGIEDISVIRCEN